MSKFPHLHPPHLSQLFFIERITIGNEHGNIPYNETKVRHADVQIGSDVKTGQLFALFCIPESIFYTMTVCDKVCTHVIIILSHTRPPTLCDLGFSRRLILIWHLSSEIWHSLFWLIATSVADKPTPSFSGHNKYLLCLRRGGSKFLRNLGDNLLQYKALRHWTPQS